MPAYKKFNFEYYPKLRNGNFLGELVSVNKKEKTKSYELKLSTDELFARVHGTITVHYTIYEDRKVILLTNITPESILEEGHRTEFSTYKGVIISKSNPEKDMFKIKLVKALEGEFEMNIIKSSKDDSEMNFLKSLGKDELKNLLKLLEKSLEK